MMELGDRMYVKGYTGISSAAVERLKELGVELRYHKRIGGYDSFYLPVGNDGSEFHHSAGNPQTTGTLRLKSEVLE